MIVIDEYLAVRVVGGAWPEGLPDDEDLALPASRHWRLLQRVHAPGDGQLSQILAQLSEAGRDGIRHPHPEVLAVLDPRPLLDDAAALAARYGGGLLIAETPRRRAGPWPEAVLRHPGQRRPPPGPSRRGPRHRRPRHQLNRSRDARIPVAGQNNTSHTDAPAVPVADRAPLSA